MPNRDARSNDDDREDDDASPLFPCGEFSVHGHRSLICIAGIHVYFIGKRRGQAPATGSAPPIQVEVGRYHQTSTRGG